MERGKFYFSVFLAGFIGLSVSPGFGMTADAGKACRSQIAFELGVPEEELLKLDSPVRVEDGIQSSFFQRYKSLVRTATIAATTQLSSNRDYRFRATKEAYCQPPKEWVSVDQKNDSFVATSLGSIAVRSFYKSKCSSECVVGRQIAELALLMELFGADFDRVFDQTACHIGTWPKVVRGRQHPFYRRDFPTVAFKGLAALPNQWGAAILYGMSGYVGNTLGEPFLDHPSDRGENFVVVDASDVAFRRLIELSSDNQIQTRNNRIQALARLMSIYQIRAAFGLRRDNPFPRFLVTKKMKEMKSLLDDPFYHEIKVYVHDMGVKTFAEILIKLLELNPRTPYYISFVVDSPINHGLYDLFLETLKTRLKSCQESPQRNALLKLDSQFKDFYQAFLVST